MEICCLAPFSYKLNYFQEAEGDCVEDEYYVEQDEEVYEKEKEEEVNEEEVEIKEEKENETEREGEGAVTFEENEFKRFVGGIIITFLAFS